MEWEPEQGTALIIAAERNDFKSCEVLIKSVLRGLEGKSEKEESNQFGTWVNKFHRNRTALHIAAKNGNVNIIKLLVQNQADYFLLAEDGTNVLHTSAFCEEPFSVVYFIEKGVPVDIQDGQG
jgi:ankyrin repeat protein